jgi:ubiquinone/menaquinone biosynthesis C-methylase UbiE
LVFLSSPLNDRKTCQIFLEKMRKGFKEIMKNILKTISNSSLKFRKKALYNKNYWTKHNVTLHKQFKSPKESLDYFRWRNSQYIYFEDLMSCSGFDQKVVLDYGCGPGNDLIGFIELSKPKKVYGFDVSSSSIVEAKKRVKLHELGNRVDFLILDEDDFNLPLPDKSIDYIHSCGVIHHIENPKPILKEFNRVLKDDGFGRVLLYNFNSIWVNLFVPYEIQILNSIDSNLSLEEAFRHSTDGRNCPVSRFYQKNEVEQIFRDANFISELKGVAISLHEMKLLPKRFDAIGDSRLGEVHRNFLSALEFDKKGVPYFKGEVAGIDAIYEFKKIN